MFEQFEQKLFLTFIIITIIKQIFFTNKSLRNYKTNDNILYLFKLFKKNSL